MVCLEAALWGSVMELANLVYRGLQAYPSFPLSTRAMLGQPSRWSPYHTYGIKTPRDIMPTSVLLFFSGTL